MQAVTQEPAPLTTTSYALLSLLALRPWTTYELAKQMQRSLHWFWPRAESKLYVEPRKLEAGGLVRSQTRYQGRRPSTVYTITPAGRRALTAWVRRPGNPGPVLEFEALLRIFAADAAGVDDLRAVLESVRDEMEAARAFGDALGAELAETGGPFPDRVHINALVHRFMSLYVDAVHQWALWALDEIGDWSDTGPAPAKADRARTTFRTPIAQSAAETSKRLARR
jgi:PadR family transcriptional regulator, regulatory protein AphA